MGTITKWNVFFVLVASLALTLTIGGIGPSRAFGWDCGCDYYCDHENGWMTGGGSIFAKPTLVYGGQVGSDGRVTHGFVVHCTPRNSDNLEIVDHDSGLNFHLLDLDDAICLDDPSIVPNPPDAAFDTFIGRGVGRCKGGNAGDHWAPCYIHFTFTDGGERGGCIRDFAKILITQGGRRLLDIDGEVDCGNHQAHDGF